MYPAHDLNRLARHKVSCRQRIARRRSQCVRAAARLAEPLAWLDRMMAHWRRLSPFARLAAVPLGFLLRRAASPRPRLLGTLLRWAPLAAGALRGFARPRRK